jgi:hypothetical protein
MTAHAILAHLDLANVRVRRYGGRNVEYATAAPRT